MMRSPSSIRPKSPIARPTSRSSRRSAALGLLQDPWEDLCSEEVWARSVGGPSRSASRFTGPMVPCREEPCVPRAQFNAVVRGAGLSALAHGVMLVLVARAAVHTPVLAVDEQAASGEGTASQFEASLAWVDLAPPPLGERPPEAEPPAAAVAPGDENRIVAL